MPITADFELQAGQESTAAWGTQVAPTVLLAGIQDVDISPIVDVQRITDEMTGTRIPSRQSLVHMVGGEGTISGLLSYDDFPYILQGLFGRADSDSTAKIGFSSDTDGIEATKVWGAPVKSSDTEDAISYTLLHGDGTNWYSLNGATVNSMNITGESGAPLEFSVDFIGMSVTSDMPADLSNRVVTYAMGNHVRLYIGNSTDAPGAATNATSDIGWSFDLTIDANREPKRHLNDLTPTDYREGKMDGTLSLSLEMTSDTEPHIDDIISATKEGVEKNIRIAARSGNSDSIFLDFSGVLMGDPGIFEDVDGTVSIDLELEAQLGSNNVASDWFSATVQNAVEALV